MIRVRRILYPTDFTAASAQAYFHAVALAEAHGAALTVLQEHGGPVPRSDVMRRVGERLDGQFTDILPVGADDLERCEPVYESMPGWTESTVGVKSFEGLPKAAQNYIKRMETLCGVPVDMISTGPDREETIVLRHPFK